MKLKSLYSFLLATALVACNEDFNEGIAGYQTNDPEDAAATVSFSATPASETAIDLGNLAEGTTMVKVCSFTPTKVGEGVKLSYVLDMKYTATDGTLANQKFKLNEAGEVKVDELQSLVETAFNKRPVERSFDAYVFEYQEVNKQTVMGKSEKFVIKLIPEAPVIAEAYYMIGNMFKVDENNDGWKEVTEKGKFTHSDQDVYVDSKFTLIFTTTEANQYWKIIPIDNINSGNLGNMPGDVGVVIDGDDAMSGNLINKDCKAGKIADPGMYRITLDMMEYTYEIKKIMPEYFLVGDVTSWDAENAKYMFYPQGDKKYAYITNFANASGSTNVKIWLGADFGNWDNCYGTTTNGDKAVSGNLVSVSAGAIACPEADVLYKLEVDFSTNTYVWTKQSNQTPVTYNNISLIGEFNGWDAENGTEKDLEMVTPHNWYIANFEPGKDGELKLRANHDWSIAWGAPVENVTIADKNYLTLRTADGKNFTVPNGKYNVFFNDITGEVVFQTVE
ncbi:MULTISPECIES: DUF5115 domain-containing protein [Bacteroides]|uniref:Outer membrane protein SusF domain-containing protein n=1 Tax=Bacteroides TaxID=816 RepID=UPI000E42F59D|nr:MULTISPECIES: DUF5115 domain-containing protein [Bacteroides]MBS7573679.1 DUF5115 domain-containing protein [Bacteroides propionicigenes]RGM28758.1 DUF5115 domain-containing protein [Bacteroides sp. OM08-17BH]HBO07725.1 DUF5115 domain-containing protein [Bacteroides sp.]